MMKKSFLALACVAATLAPLAGANAATLFLSQSAGSPTTLNLGDVGTANGINDAGYLDSTGKAEYFFDFSKSGTATSFLGSLQFTGAQTATVSLSGSSVSTVTAPSFGSLSSGSFGVDAGANYVLTVTGAPNAAFVANITDVSAVPEPAAWALMLAGFSGLGLALRNARRKTAALAAV